MERMVSAVVLVIVHILAVVLYVRSRNPRRSYLKGAFLGPLVVAGALVAALFAVASRYPHSGDFVFAFAAALMSAIVIGLILGPWLAFAILNLRVPPIERQRGAARGIPVGIVAMIPACLVVPVSWFERNQILTIGLLIGVGALAGNIVGASVGLAWSAWQQGMTPAVFRRRVVAAVRAACIGVVVASPFAWQHSCTSFELGWAGNTPELQRRVKSRNYTVRQRARSAYVRFNAVEALNGPYRLEAALMLAGRDDRRALPALREAIATGVRDESTGVYIVDLLSRMSGSEPRAVLRDAAASPDANIRESAQLALARPPGSKLTDYRSSAGLGPPIVLRTDGSDSGQVWEYGQPQGEQPAAFSRDGRWVAFASDSQAPGGYVLSSKVTIWSAANGDLLHSLVDTSAGNAVSVAFSPDGSAVAVLSEDKQPGASKGAGTSIPGKWIELWNVRSGEMVRRWNVGPSAGHSLVFSPSGNLIATTWNGRISLWDARTGSLKGRLGDDGSATILAFSADGKSIVTASGAARIARWDLATGRQSPLPGAGAGSPVAFGPNGENVVVFVKETGGWRRMATVRQVRAGGQPSSLATGSEALAATVSGSGNRVAVGCNDDAVRVWDVPSMTLIGRFVITGPKSVTGTNLGATGIALSHDGRKLFGSDGRGNIMLWTLPPSVRTAKR